MEEWRRLVEAGEAVLPGAVRQEVLSGIRRAEDFEELRKRLAAFRDLPVTEADFEEAARCFNRCRAKGLVLSAVDMFICAIAIRRRLPLFTLDGDFRRLARVLPLRLHEVPAARGYESQAGG